MRVVTWNIEQGADVDGAIETLRRVDELREADVLLLQEMDPAGTERLADALGFEHRYAAAAPSPTTGRPFGNAVLSPWPLSDDVEVSLPHVASVSGQPRSALRCVVAVDGVDVIACSAHTEIPTLPLNRRRRQFAAVAQGVAGDRPAVIGGDFNTATSRGRRALREEMSSGGLHRGTLDLTPTLKRLRVSVRLDELFVRGLRSVGSGVSRATTASDHFPVWSELTIEAD